MSKVSDATSLILVGGLGLGAFALWKNRNKVGSWFGSVGDTIGGGLADFGSNIGSFFGGIGSSIGSGFEQLQTNISAGFADLSSKIGAVSSANFQPIVNAGSSNLTTIKENVEDAVDNVKSGNIWGFLTNTAKNNLTTPVNVVKSNLETAYNYGSNVVKTIGSWFSR